MLTAITRAGGRHSRQWNNSDMASSPYREYLALEQAASDIFIYAPQHIPDLLQTMQYAQASETRNPSFQADAERNLSRQQLLGDHRASLTALIGEPALRHAHGNPEIVRGQLLALTDVNGRTVVQILPSRCVPTSSGPTTILRFAAVPDLGAVYLHGLSGGACLTGQQDVASHSKAFEQLRRSALPAAASERLIREIAAA
jgi:hypothetical protein